VTCTHGMVVKKTIKSHTPRNRKVCQ